MHVDTVVSYSLLEVPNHKKLIFQYMVLIEDARKARLKSFQITSQ